MADTHATCERFEELLLERSAELESGVWSNHLASCAGCREQWQAHTALMATFAAERVPELSLAFEAGLERKIEASLQVVPLKGWRLAAMTAYAAAALVVLWWALSGVRLPTIDPSSPWVFIMVLVAAPLSLLLAMAASRLIPVKGVTKGIRSFAL